MGIKIYVGSENPVKVRAVEKAFSRFFSDLLVIGERVESNVPEEPIDDEIWRGAENRARALMKHEADYFVGIEGGISRLYGRWFEFGVVCIISSDGKTSFGGAPFFPLPDYIVERLLNREELSSVMDEIAGTKDIGMKNGAVGFFTNNIITREDLYIYGVILSLIPFINKAIFNGETK